LKQEGVYLHDYERIVSSEGQTIVQRIWVNDPPTEGEPPRSAWSPEVGAFEPPLDVVFVGKGNAALTRRLMAVAVYEVMMKPHRRGYSSRWGLLVRPEDLQAARADLAATETRRTRQREYSQQRREQQETTRREEFKEAGRRQFPKIPAGILDQIVAHTTEVGSRRVGRSRDADLDDVVFLAVQAWVRHHRTRYDELLRAGFPSAEARAQVQGKIDRVMTDWGWIVTDAGTGPP
jgi:hypothetical protein